jgi:hypothetical protein
MFPVAVPLAVKTPMHVCVVCALFRALVNGFLGISVHLLVIIIFDVCFILIKFVIHKLVQIAALALFSIGCKLIAAGFCIAVAS